MEFLKNCHGKSWKSHGILFLHICGNPVKQNVRFLVGICSENFQLDHIQNGRLSAIINFDMPDTRQTVPDS